MKRIIKISSLIVFTLMLSIGNIKAQAGGKQGPPPIPTDSQVKEMLVKLTNELSLNKSQEEKISALYYAHFKEARTFSAKKGSREEMEQLKKNFENEVKFLLTNEQQIKFEKIMKENRPKGGKERR